MKTSKFLLGMLVTGAVLTTTVSCKKDDAVDPKREEVTKVTEKFRTVETETAAILAGAENFEAKTTTALGEFETAAVATGGNTEASLTTLKELETSVMASKAKVVAQIGVIDAEIAKIEPLTRATVVEDAKALLLKLQDKKTKLETLKGNLDGVLMKIVKAKNVGAGLKITKSKIEELPKEVRDDFNTNDQNFDMFIDGLKGVVAAKTAATPSVDNNTGTENEPPTATYAELKTKLGESKGKIAEHKTKLESSLKKVKDILAVLAPTSKAGETDATTGTNEDAAQTYEEVVTALIAGLKEQKNQLEDRVMMSDYDVKSIDKKIAVGDMLNTFEPIYTAYFTAVNTYGTADDTKKKEIADKFYTDHTAGLTGLKTKIEEGITSITTDLVALEGDKSADSDPDAYVDPSKAIFIKFLEGQKTKLENVNLLIGKIIDKEGLKPAEGTGK